MKSQRLTAKGTLLESKNVLTEIKMSYGSEPESSSKGNMN